LSYNDACDKKHNLIGMAKKGHKRE
jgi:hypothetical protein